MAKSNEKEMTKCSICFEAFNRPKYLPCLHTFCEACLCEYIASSIQNESRSLSVNNFKCPICRTVVSAPDDTLHPEEWASKFPVNHLIVTLMDKEKIEARKKSCDPCSTNNENVPANSWCTSCSEALCSVCEKCHKTNRMSRHHKVVSITEITDKTPLIKTTEYCEKHLDKKLELFCMDHDIALCFMCMTVSHRKCDEVLPLEEVAKGVRSNQDLTKVTENLSKLISDFEKILQFKKTNVKTIETEKEQIELDIKTFRQDLNKHLDFLESELEYELETTHKQIIMEIDNEIKEFDKRSQVTKEIRGFLDICTKHAEETQLYLEMNKAKKRLKELSEFLQSRVSEIKRVRYTFRFNDGIRHVSEQIKTLGEISLEKSQNVADLPQFIGNNPNLKNCNAKERANFTIDGNHIVTGGVLLQNGDLVLVSMNHDELFVYDQKGLCKKKLQLPRKVFDVTLVSSRTVVATSFEDTQIFIVNVEKMSITKVIQLERNCRGITSTTENIIVNCYPELITMDLDGKVCHQSTIQGGAWYIAACVDKIYCSYISGENSVYCMTEKGSESFKYKSNDLKHPIGISVDRDSNVYLADYLSKNIHQLTPDGKLIKLIDTQFTSNTRVIAFSKQGNTFFVTSDSKVAIYDME